MEFLEKNISPETDGTGANQLFLLLSFVKKTPSSLYGYELSKIRTSKGTFSIILGIGKRPEEGELEKALGIEDGYSIENSLSEIRENHLENEIVFRENAHIRIMKDDGSFLGVVFSDYEDALIYVEKYLDGGI